MLPLNLPTRNVLARPVSGYRLPAYRSLLPLSKRALTASKLLCKTFHCAVSFTMSTLCSIPAVNQVNEHKHKQTQAKAHRLANGLSVFISCMNLYDICIMNPHNHSRSGWYPNF